MSKSILQEAYEIIFGDREAVYGSPTKNFEVIANFWENYLRARGHWDENSCGLMTEDVCYMMALLKIARLTNNTAHHDSKVDACGYIALADRIQNGQ